MQTQKSNILYKLFLIIIGGVTIGPILLIILFSLWTKFTSVIQDNDKVYYIPQTKMYIKLTYDSWKGIGTVFFSPYNNFDKSNSLDFIKLFKTSSFFTTEIRIIPSIDKKIYIMDEDHSLIEKHSCSYELLHVQHLCDTLYAEMQSKIMPICPNCYWTDSLPITQKHITIVIGSCFEEILISDINDSFLKKAVEFK